MDVWQALALAAFGVCGTLLGWLVTSYAAFFRRSVTRAELDAATAAAVETGRRELAAAQQLMAANLARLTDLLEANGESMGREIGELKQAVKQANDKLDNLPCRKPEKCGL